MSSLSMNQAGGFSGLGYMASSEAGYADLLRGNPDNYWDVMRDRDAWRKGRAAPAPRTGTSTPTPRSTPTSTPTSTPSGPTGTTATGTSATGTAPKRTYTAFTMPVRTRRQSSLAPLATMFPGAYPAAPGALAPGATPAASVGKLPSWAVALGGVVVFAAVVMAVNKFRRKD